MTYWITFRLADALPQDKLRQLSAAREEWIRAQAERAQVFAQKIDHWLDTGYGERHLARPEIRPHVGNCLLRFDGERLRLHAAVIMPNHVHALLEPIGEQTLSDLLKGIKGASARLANQALARSGAFWMDETYDHIVRSDDEYERYRRYIRENPAQANLSPPQYWLYPNP